MYQCYFAPLELHLADGATVAVISQLSTMCPLSIFTMDTNIFKLHSYRVFLVDVLWLIQQLLAISWRVLVIILWQ